MKTVYKYKLDFTDKQQLQLPKGAKVLALQMQEDYPHIWAEVDTTADPDLITFYMIATGDPLGKIVQKSPVTYIGTFQTASMRGNPLVFHVWREGDNS